MVMLMGCLWVAYACIHVSLMVSSTFLMQLPRVSFWFLVDFFGKDVSWHVLQVRVLYVSLSLCLYTFSVGSLLYVQEVFVLWSCFAACYF